MSMDMYVAKSQFHEFVAFWRGAGTHVNFYIAGSLELRFERDMKESARYLMRSLNSVVDFQSESFLIEFATEIILFLSPNGRKDSIDVLKKSKFPVGFKNRRVWRELILPGVDMLCVPYSEVDFNDYKFKLRAVRNASELFREFSDGFRYLEPHVDNYGAFSNKLRDFLILACTEIEANFSGILGVNNVKPSAESYNASDYARLIDVLYLKEWVVSLGMHFGCGSVQPFKEWDPEKATQTLPWYSAYNKVKHDAYENLNLATFLSVYNAMAALYILMIAQWGTRVFNDLGLRAPFDCIRLPLYDIGDIPVTSNLQSEPQYIDLPI